MKNSSNSLEYIFKPRLKEEKKLYESVVVGIAF